MPSFKPAWSTAWQPAWGRAWDKPKSGGIVYYLDPATGNDANNGLSPSTAFASVTPIASLNLTGKTLRIARGSVIYDELIISHSGVRVSAYGTGAAPILNCTAAIPAMTKTVGRTNVYEAAITLPGNSKIMGNAFADTTILTQVSSLALCDSTPGSSYVLNWASASTTMYIHAAGSVDPNTDGKAYRYSKRSHGLKLTGTDCRVDGIRGFGNAHQDGSIVCTGEGSVVSNCYADDGCRHNAFVAAGALVIGCTFTRGRNDLEAGQAGNGLVCYQNLVTGKSYSTRRCVFDGGTGGGPFVGILQHGADASDLFESVPHTENTFINCSSAITAKAVQTNLTLPVFTGTSTGATASTGGTLTISGGTGTLNRMFSSSGPVALNSSGNNLTTVSLDGSVPGYYRATDASLGSLTITGDVIDFTGPGPNVNGRIVDVDSGTISLTNCNFGPALATAIDDVVVAGSAGTATYVGAGNVFPYGSRFVLNGTTYNTLAEWQAAGKDLTSSEQPLPTAVASDDFNRPDEYLEASANWTRVGGVIQAAAIRSNKLATLLSTATLYRRAVMASSDHWIRFTVEIEGVAGGPFAVVKAADEANWIGVRWTATVFQVYKNIAGSITPVSATPTALVPVVGDVVVFAVRAGRYWLYVNGRQIARGKDLNAAALIDNTGVGIACTGASKNPFIDNFSCGLL